MTDLDGITVFTEPSEGSLNEHQISDYRSQREDCLKRLLTFGKDPDKVEGYAFETVRARAYRMDMFYRWVWEQEGLIYWRRGVSPPKPIQLARHTTSPDRHGQISIEPVW